ncbi:MAG TPA: alpha/beta hydrolase [Candidatus Binataceae bacterium]|nr:alpha/beta hydrolase [Candidatus Binataceae bacterium]
MPKVKAGKININYEKQGKGEPLLLIMGFGAPGAAWIPWLPFLSAKYECIYFDNRGTGHSDKPDMHYTVPDMAEDASGLLRALGIPKAKVFGVSMGGMIAQELTLTHPEQVEKVVLGCTTPGGPNAAMASMDVLQTLIEGSKLMGTDPEKAYDKIMPILTPPGFAEAHPEFKAMMLAMRNMIPPTPPETADRAMAGIVGFNAYDRLPQIKCPVLIVHGDSDILVPTANAKIIKSRIPHADVFMIPGAGHLMEVLDPVGVTGRIVEWLSA